ncbi:MAG: C25 family cysteine peptidase [Sumerlaeia bacterium]
MNRLTTAFILTLLALTVFASTSVLAGFTLESAVAPNKASPSGFHATLRFSPRNGGTLPPEALGRELSLSPASPLVADFGAEALAPRALSNSAFLTQSTYLAVPGLGQFDPADWKVAVATVSGQPLDAQTGVTLAPVAVGPAEGLQVTVDPTAWASETAPGTELLITVSGPASTTKGLATIDLAEEEVLHRVVRRTFLNGETVTALPARPRATKAAPIPSPPGDYRIAYRNEPAIYRVPLSLLGADPSSATQVLLDHHAVIVPPLGTDGNDLLVTAPFRYTDDADTDALFASVGDSPTTQATIRPAFESLAPLATEAEHTITRRHEYDLYFEWAAQTAPLDRFFFWRNTGGNRPYNIPIHDELTTTALTISAELHGYNINDSAFDHGAKLRIQGVDTKTDEWEGKTVHVLTDSIFLPSLPSGDTIEVRHIVTPRPSGTSAQNLNWYDLTYTGYFRLDPDNQCLVDLPADSGPRRVTVGGFDPATTSGAVLVVDITNPQLPQVVANPPVFTYDAGAAAAVEFDAPSSHTTFFVTRLDAITTPPVITVAKAMPVPPIAEFRLERIYVRPDEFAAALSPLVAHYGAGTIELDPQAAYDAYNGGQKSPEALREALVALLDHSPSHAALPDFLLVAHGNSDPRGELDPLDAPQIPVFNELSPEYSFGFLEVPLDYPYTLFEGGDLLPDASFGRIPAKTPQEVANFVDRQIRFDALVETLRDANRPALWVTDDNDDFDNDGFSIYWEDVPLWDSYWAPTGHGSAHVGLLASTPNNDPVTRAAIQNAFADGTAFALYMGHGSDDIWTGERIVTTDDIMTGLIATEDNWPIVATFTCLNGNFAYPNATKRSMAEAWTIVADHGAIGNICPVSADYYFEQKQFAIAVMSLLSQSDAVRPRTIGELLLQARIDFHAQWPFFDETLKEYTIFGDPAANLTLDGPRPAALPDWDSWE